MVRIWNAGCAARFSHGDLKGASARTAMHGHAVRRAQVVLWIHTVVACQAYLRLYPKAEPVLRGSVAAEMRDHES